MPHQSTGVEIKWLSGRIQRPVSMSCCSSDRPPINKRDILAARERLRSASLASTDQMVTAKRPEKCPRARDRFLVDLVSGEAVPDRCRSSQCLYCLPINARRRALAITLTCPVRMIRLSLLADARDDNPCRTALVRIKRTRQALKRMGLAPGEWSYTLERNPKGTGYHAHCLQTGGYIEQAKLQEACERAGAGFPHINSITRQGVWTSRYGLKGFGADGYGLKTFRPQGNPAEALRINNGRLEHHTRGFFNYDGEILKVRDMERLAIAAVNQHRPVAIMAMRGIDVERVMGDLPLRHRMILDVNQRTAAKLRAVR